MLLRDSAARPRPPASRTKLIVAAVATFAITVGLVAEITVSQLLDTQIKYNEWQANQNAPPTSRNTGHCKL